jgi:mRNA-degrading endonuclease RelE of RelBE toxin-antitoxin system
MVPKLAEVFFEPIAEKEFLVLPKRVQLGFVKKMDHLSSFFGGKCSFTFKWLKRLTEDGKVWRIRQGRYRLLFEYDSKKNSFLVKTCFLKRSSKEYARFLRNFFEFLL